MLQLYRSLIKLRRLHSGTLQKVAANNHVLCYERAEGEHSILVLLNFASGSAKMSGRRGTILVSTCLEREGETVSGTVALNGAEGLVIELLP